MRRVVIPEFLDTDSGSAAEVEDALRDLRMFSRYFGGTSTTASLLRRIAEASGKRELSVLDVAAGPGESVLGAARELEQEGIRLRPTLIDRSASHLPRNGIPTVVGDALRLPFADNSFDVATSSLFVHHLEPEEIVAYGNETLRVSRVATVVNDLHRSAMHLGLVYAGMPLYRSRITRHDAVASVRRAYTPDELRDALRRSGARVVEISQHFLYRLGVIAWKNNPGPASSGPARRTQ